MNKRENIELLSPAKNADVGIEAVYHGADAVYIGGPKFGARAAAGNSLEDIERLAKVAHTYYARVYVALNTILTDRELAETEQLIHQLYNAGVDALIVQDMGITQLNLPPISLHASTQMDNRTPEKVKFLQDAGFDQVVLARELSLNEIKNISSQTSVRLEGFVHGALCVSYSGQCYLSQALCGRSANRGACAQFCRLPYTLRDADGKVIANNQHLLSLRDFNMSDHLPELIEAGISSLKIEGRLKDVDYVKNVTAYYRQRLDDYLGKDNPYSRSSVGKSTYIFTPDVNKSFNRGFTTYFTEKRQQIGSFITPKSQGEYLGTVAEVGRNYLTIKTDKHMANGDGFCYISKRGEFLGFKVNRVEGNRVFPLSMPNLTVGTKLNRNQDAAFDKLLSKPTATRKIQIEISINDESASDFKLTITCADHISLSKTFTFEAEVANNAVKALDTVKTQLAKTGNTPYEVTEVKVDLSQPYFLPASVLADWRRTLIEEYQSRREELRQHEDRQFQQTSHPFIKQVLDYKGNVYNSQARKFYTMHGVTDIADAFEAGKEHGDVDLMHCRHCIRYSLGMCTKVNRGPYREPFYLENAQGAHLQLVFDCRNCEMHIRGRQK